MKPTIQKIQIVSAFILFTLLIPGCDPNLVLIPDADHDHAPVITVHSMPSGPGKVSPGEVSVTSGSAVGVTEKTNVLITVNATNMGAVKSLSIAGYWGGNKLWEAKTETSKNAQNKGPKTLSIIGHNGHGGIGSQPLIIAFGKLNEVGYVEADAVNFNGQTTHLQVNYQVKPADLIP